MSALTNARHERFAQDLAKGLSAREAYKAAGYTCKTDAVADACASRLLSDAKVSARVAEITERAAVRVELTVASATETLLRLAQQGEKLGDAAGISAARAAVMDACKLNGLVVDKSESVVDQVQRIISDKPQTEAEWAEAHGVDLGAAAGTAARAH